ncbi:MAG TPA: SprT family zinc-dependent metalloprotease [Candidatus Saccharimonadales bacterium]|nr:SprT family zinc-dependent metalloprotease [Candidatus Saccharimonadales bacterium]
MAFKEFQLDEVGPVTVYKRRGSRSIRLTLASDGKVKVTIPAWSSFSAGFSFAKSRQSWIIQNRPVTERPLAEGQAIGKAHRLHFLPDATVSGVSTRTRGSQIIVTFPAYMATHDDAVQIAVQNASHRALKQEATKLLKIRLDELADKYDYNYRSLSVKRLKGRWGSCDQDKNLIFNVYLMQVPWELIDYVIMHELAHTRVMQHGTPFWEEMERHLPDAKHLRKRLGNYRPVLRTPGAV